MNDSLDIHADDSYLCAFRITVVLADVLPDDLGVVSPDDVGERILQAAQELGGVRLGRVVMRRAWLQPLGPSVGLWSRQVEVDVQLDSPLPWLGVIDTLRHALRLPGDSLHTLHVAALELVRVRDDGLTRLRVDERSF